MYYLYLITDTINNKIYIGQTVRPKERWSQHKAYAKREKPIQYVHRAMAKYGIINFKFEVIATCRTQEDADYIEAELIKQYDSRDKECGYNIARGDHAWNAGLPKEQQPMYGKKQSDYQKKRCAEVHSGWKNPHTKEWRDNLSKIMAGRMINEAWREKISSAQRMFSKEREIDIYQDRMNGMLLKELSEKYGCSVTSIDRIIKRNIVK